MKTFAVVLAVFAGGAGFALAQGHDAERPAIETARSCLLVNDYAFEHSLRDGLDDADRIALVEVFEVATFECLGLSMQICEAAEDGLACLDDLSDWVRAERAAIVARLPGEVAFDNAFTVRRYERTLERAGASADAADCDQMSDTDSARYCEIVSEGGALEDAYDVWRMARRAGVVDLEGHDPIDLELIR